MVLPFRHGGETQHNWPLPRESVMTSTPRQNVTRLSGYAPALPTPFNESGGIDIAALEHLCDRQIQEGASALVVCGTTGEAPNLSRAEHDSIVPIAVNAAQGRIPVIAGAGSNSTSQAIDLSRDAQAVGADAVLSVVPYYNKPTQEGMYAHFRAIAAPACRSSSTTCRHAPCAVSPTTPLRGWRSCRKSSVSKTQPATSRGCCACDLCWGGSSDCCPAMTRPRPPFWRWAATAAYPSNVAPALCRAMYLALSQGQPAQAQRLATVAATLTAALSSESNPAPVKYALSLMNIMSPRVRLPLVELQAESKARIDRVMAKTCAEYPDYLIANAARRDHDIVLSVNNARPRPKLVVASYPASSSGGSRRRS
jgi:4-hydroxy-tetrahydrodipicolinate synthase